MYVPIKAARLKQIIVPQTVSTCLPWLLGLGGVTLWGVEGVDMKKISLGKSRFIVAWNEG
jgi:hypothetical protein